jgi:hypothetical protein
MSTSPKTVDELIELLNSFNIDYSNWVKPVTTLFDEIQNNDCYLDIVDGELRRFVDVMKIHCYYTKDNKQYLLKEEKQVFKDGKVRSRNHYHVAEKIQKGEFLLAAAVRALKEELQVTVDSTKFIHNANMDTVNSANANPSYSGLVSVYHTFNFTMDFDDDQYNPDGYQEVQESKTTYFVWVQTTDL